ACADSGVDRSQLSIRRATALRQDPGVRTSHPGKLRRLIPADSAMRQKPPTVESAHSIVAWFLCTATVAIAGASPFAQEPAPQPRIEAPVKSDASPGLPPPSTPNGQQVLPINLPTALQLANARAIDIAIASARIKIAVAQFERARVLWLPSLQLGF